MENTNETMSPIEPIEEKEEYPKTLCSVIPLMLCRVPFNPNVVDWENTSIEGISQAIVDLINLRFAMITTKDPVELQRCQQNVDEVCGHYMEQFGFDGIDYDGMIREINDENIRQYPSDFRQLLLVNDVITIYSWIATNLRYYNTLRELHTHEECLSILKDVVYSTETFNQADPEPVDEAETEMVRDNIINDNQEFLNNPDNITDEDLRAIINSFNDDHSVSGLLDD